MQYGKRKSIMKMFNCLSSSSMLTVWVRGEQGESTNEISVKIEGQPLICSICVPCYRNLRVMLGLLCRVAFLFYELFSFL